jgi:MoaA/NifB/PqqE/SkfB family radical SAM enzyme
MQKISQTFCPAKWDELYVSFEMNYAYACCRSTTTKFTNQVDEFILKEKENLLNDIQDPSCKYCWQAEKASNTSLRHRYLDKFDTSTYPQYQLNQVTPKLLQISLGNECNFQCTYCSPKFSSQWQHDVSKQPYRVFTDRFFYGIDEKQPDALNKSIEYLKTFDQIEKLDIIGGEPLINKKFFTVLDSVKSQSLHFCTNLSVKQSVLEQILARCNNYTNVNITVSLDATDKIAEFVRHGLIFNEFDSNLNYLIANRPANVKLVLNSAVTSVTIRDLENFSSYVIPKLPNLIWNLVYCIDPRIQTLETLPDQYKPEILKTLEKIKDLDNIYGVQPLIDLVTSVKFNSTLHKEMKHFFNEFATRKNIEIPLCLD